ncbi:hypothetical protein NGB74_00555 [Staphylococcus chromogenes]|uniref:hypothetical protein n=1 Tax=Staphylococcus chromogenes TaxID=46126 RepID=UPI001F2FAAB5|nr:hypothetical protein [Staphylococcus chromogenes]MDU0475375.1 hypothetical protein [Staphylococcus chromogenes]MEB7449497.1 hypothetical protein [Staphylococcus chromogenes]
MFKDLVYYTLGTELDTFVQYFVFELILLVLIGLAIVLITKNFGLHSSLFLR